MTALRIEHVKPTGASQRDVVEDEGV